MSVRPIIALACVLALGAGSVAAQSVRPSEEIAAAVASPTRTAANRGRDRYRHPAETLAFFGVKPTQTVVEFIPGGGWYTEILAPMTKDQGHYVGLVPTAQAEPLRSTLAAKTALYRRCTGRDGRLQDRRIDAAGRDRRCDPDVP